MKHICIITTIASLLTLATPFSYAEPEIERLKRLKGEAEAKVTKWTKEIETREKIEALKKELPSNNGETEPQSSPSNSSGGNSETGNPTTTKSSPSGSLGTFRFGPDSKFEPGWYPDPFSENKKSELLRYSDGTNWTKHRVGPDGHSYNDSDFSPIAVEEMPSHPDRNSAWRWPKKYKTEEGWLRGNWSLDWQSGKVDTRFIYDSDGANENFDAFEDGRLSVALEFLTIYGRKKIPYYDVEWGPSVGFGVAAIDTQDNGQNSVMMTTAGLYIRPIEKNWQLEWGIINALSGNDSAGFSSRNDNGLYFGISVGALHDSAKK